MKKVNILTELLTWRLTFIC